MRDKIPYMLWALCIITIISEGDLYAGLGSAPPPFSISSGIGGVVPTEGQQIKPNTMFSYDIHIKSWDKSLSSIRVEFSIPPEVIVRRGELIWQGDLNPNSEKYTGVSLSSTTDWSKWSSSVKAHIEVEYEGIKYHKDMQWSQKGYENTCWRSEYGERDKVAGRADWGCKKGLTPWGDYSLHK